ncbi:tripartite tricarboxylate transporter substrate binding protein [Polaromonas sp.]|uniref:Bug family tripartite tricarboxylate transporter substrate binding protein n=1 Tax=Polaromonas sp. TaxID=1869339 RepID=UPI001D980250|nr:tripartite tricarboxylate transporter substrate binding protein [Polaromonas sp.]MBT9476064.1 tripartite tricarboxylate transporter substrate binding protein [Polaromonas sp.]
MLSRRHLVAHSLLLGAAFSLPLAASAQTAFPSRPLRIVVPNAPGGAADLTARAVGQKMGEAMGQPVVIDNKPGAGGVSAGDMVAKAAPDGHTLLLISSGTAVSASLFKSLPFDTVKDFIPVALLASFDLVIVVAEGGRFKTLSELVAWGKANPGKLNIGTPNIGTTQHLAAELFKSAAGLDAQIVPFNGTPAVINALRGGQIDVGLDILSPLLSQIKAKALHPLAITGAQRSRMLPEVPTAKEAGVPGFAVASWNGLAVPANTPKEVVARLNREVTAALNDPDVKKRLEALNLDPQPGTPEQAAALLNNDIKRWGDVIVRARIPRL